MNWNGDVPTTMAKRHARHLALHFYLAKLRPMQQGAVVLLGSAIYFTLPVPPACDISVLLLGLPVVMERVGEHTGTVAVVQHTKWKYCSRIMQHGTTIMYEEAGVVCVALVERLFEIAGLFIVSYRPYQSQIHKESLHCVLPDLSLEVNERAMEINTQKMTVAHRCIVGGKCYILNC